MSDIVARLRAWRELHLTRLGALFDEAADEIERLRTELEDEARINGRGGEREARLMAIVAEREAEIRRFAESEQSLFDRCADQQHELARLRLTDAEREAVEWFACYGVDRPLGHATTLRGLLERTK